MTTKQDMEKQIVGAVLSKALEKNYLVSVRNGGMTDELTQSTNKDEILNEMFATDHDTLYFYAASKPQECLGWIMFVYGNDGFDVISDYSANDSMEELVAASNELQELFGEESAE